MTKFLRNVDVTKENDLLSNIDKLHTTELGSVRIQKNLSLNTDNVVNWCNLRIQSPDSSINKKGKNWYITVDNCK